MKTCYLLCENKLSIYVLKLIYFYFCTLIFQVMLIKRTVFNCTSEFIKRLKKTRNVFLLLINEPLFKLFIVLKYNKRDK